MNWIRWLLIACIALLASCAVLRKEERMGFEINVYGPTGTYKATYTTASPGGILEPFKWRVLGDGNAVEFSFFGRPDAVNVTDHDIIKLTLVNEKIGPSTVQTFIAFTGKLLERPDPRATGAVEYRVVGLKEWANWSRQNYSISNAAIQDFVNSYLVPTMPSFISSQGVTIGSGYGSRSLDIGPTSTAFALDEMAKSAIVPAGTKPVTWGIDQYGKTFFQQPTSSTNVPYADVWLDPEKIRIASDQVVTAVTLILGQSDRSDGRGEAYRKPHTISYRVESPDHATYRREIVQSVSGVVFEVNPSLLIWYRGNVFMFNYGFAGQTNNYGPFPEYDLDATYISYIENVIDSAIGDDNFQTFYNGPVATGGSSPADRQFVLIEAQSPAGYRLIGARWEIDAPGQYGDSRSVSFMLVPYMTAGTKPVNKTGVVKGKPVTQVYNESGLWSGQAVLGGSENDLTDNMLARWILYTPFTDGSGNDLPIRIRTIKLICVKMDVLDQAAKSLLKSPSAVVEKVVIPYYTFPNAVLNITGAPGGTITGNATEYSYTYSSDRGVETTIMLGTTSVSESARAMRLLAKDLDQAASISARLYSDRR